MQYLNTESKVLISKRIARKVEDEHSMAEFLKPGQQKHSTLVWNTALKASEYTMSFDHWFREVRQIEPVSLKPDEIQPLIDQFINSEEGSRNLRIASGGSFFHCWPDALQVPFLQLTQSMYCREIKTDWCIDIDHKVDPDRFIVCKNSPSS